MRIADVLRNKGAAVVTINPDATVRELLAGLAEQNIGAMVVVGDRGCRRHRLGARRGTPATHARRQRAVSPDLHNHDRHGRHLHKVGHR